MQPIELEHEGKRGKIFRIYDQTRLDLISSYEFEVGELKQQYENLPQREELRC